MIYRARIADLPLTERPRERLMSVGAQNLSDAELLALLLATGQSRGGLGLSAVGLGQHILKELSKYQRDPLDMLRDITPSELMEIPGIGPAKASTILAAIELGKRAFQRRPLEKMVIDHPSLAASALSHDLMWQSQEKFAIVLLDVKNKLVGTKIITIGTATETLVHPRDIFREVIKQGGTRLIIGHNHPSGNIEPSPEDIHLTEQLLQASSFLDIPLLDHVILGNGDYQSLRAITDLWQKYPQED